MITKIDIYGLEDKNRNTLLKIYDVSYPLATWPEIEDLFEELAYQLGGIFVPANGPDGETIVILRGVFHMFQPPHVDSLARIGIVRRYLFDEEKVGIKL